MLTVLRRRESLACTVCGSRNHSIKPGGTPKLKRLELNKFCKYCNKHTMHRKNR